MKLVLTRVDANKDGIFSELIAPGFKAAALEHSYDGKPKLPNGTYRCVRGIHRLKDLKPFDTFEVLGVPGHTGILFHVGNWGKDSDGCILIGEKREGNMIVKSRLTFQKFMDCLKGLNEFTLEVK